MLNRIILSSLIAVSLCAPAFATDISLPEQVKSQDLGTHSPQLGQSDDIEFDFSDDEFPFQAHMFTLIGYQGLQLDGINQATSAQGYSPFSEHSLGFGGGLQFIVNRFLTEFEGMGTLTAPVNNDSYWSSLSAGTALLNFGYQVRPVKNLSIYPIVGAGMSFVDMTFSQRNVQPSFDEFLSSPGRQGSISNFNFALNLGLGVDWAWDWGGLVGIRGGVILNPFPNNFWVVNDLNNTDSDNNNALPVTNAPNVQLNGPYIRLVAGF